MAAVLFGGAAPLVADDDDGGVGLEVGADYATLYLFRGLRLLGDEPVWAARAELSAGNFLVYAWGYAGDIPTDFAASGRRTPYREVDLGAEYAFELGARASLTLGATRLLYSGDVERELGFEDSWEVYAKLGWDVAFAPSIAFWQDVDAVDGGYLELAVAPSLPLGKRARLDFVAAVGFDFGYDLDPFVAADLAVAESDGDLSDARLGVDLPLALGEHLEIHAGVLRTFALDVAETLGERDDTVVTGGVTFAF